MLSNLKNDKRNGYGSLKSPDGSAYTGQWKNDIKHGSGIQTWAGSMRGQKYEGQYVNGKFDGSGRYEYVSIGI